MAEGLLRKWYGDHYEVQSAGTQPSGVSPFAIQVMNEIGIDIQDHTSDDIREFLSTTLDIVVTVCDSAREHCPFVPAQKNLHHRFEDPRAISGSDQEKIATFRRVRDQIQDWIVEYFNPDSR